jgi:glycosyltransferase involved in cell wall biosynthesis
VQEGERCRIEHETFAYAALKPLLEGDYDIVHCLEKEVCNVVFDNRHLARRTPKVLFSNGGAIPAPRLPRCDFVQEHTEHNLRYSATHKAFVIPHGVDVERFRPGLPTTFRAEHGIPDDAFVVISVGTICHHHKRMDYVIREVAAIPSAYLVIVGQENSESPAIKELGRQLMGGRVVFATMPHDELPKAYAAADVFALGSLFETFGIVYIEAMAMGLPVFCTNHANQRSIVKEGEFIDIKRRGALTEALRSADPASLRAFGRRGRLIAERTYNLRIVKDCYLNKYREISAAYSSLQPYSLRRAAFANVRNMVRRIFTLINGRAE